MSMREFQVGDRVRFNWEGQGFWRDSHFRGEGTVVKVNYNGEPFFPFEVQPDWDTVESNLEWDYTEQTAVFSRDELSEVDDA